MQNKIIIAQETYMRKFESSSALYILQNMNSLLLVAPFLTTNVALDCIDGGIGGLRSTGFLYGSSLESVLILVDGRGM
jgi:hypothetical protein